MRLPSSPDITEVQSTGIACVFVNPAYAKYKYAKHMLSLLHYVQAKEEDLPSFPVKEWGEAPVVAEGWNRDVAFSVSPHDLGSESRRRRLLITTGMCW